MHSTFWKEVPRREADPVFVLLRFVLFSLAAQKNHLESFYKRWYPGQPQRWWPNWSGDTVQTSPFNRSPDESQVLPRMRMTDLDPNFPGGNFWDESIPTIFSSLSCTILKALLWGLNSSADPEYSGMKVHCDFLISFSDSSTSCVRKLVRRHRCPVPVVARFVKSHSQPVSFPLSFAKVLPSDNIVTEVINWQLPG